VTLSLLSLDRRRLARWLLGTALAVHAVVAVVDAAGSRWPHPDIDNYYDIGTKPGRPYVDYAVEFPIATEQAFRALAAIAGTRHRLGVSIVAVNVVADASMVAALYWGWGIEAAAGVAVIVAPIVDLFFLRTDLWSTALATIAVAAWRRGRPSLAAIGIAVGAAFKLWPLTFLPLLLVPRATRRATMPIATAIAVGLAILGLWLWVAGPMGLYQVLTFRGARGWEVESTVGGAWMVFDRSTMRLESGAWRIGTMVSPISIVLFAAGTVTSLWMVWRGARTGHLGAGWAGGVSALLALSALLSAQFACWLAPAAGIAWVEGDTPVAAMTALAVFLTNLEYKSFVPLLRGNPGAIAMVLARNALLIALAIRAARLLVRAQRGASIPFDRGPA
jgi:hypothetical protein